MNRNKTASRLIQLIPWLLLFICLAATLFAWQQQQQILEAAARARFEREAARIQSATVSHMGAFDDPLRGAQGLLTLNRSIDRNQWDTYVSTLNIDQRYPGINGLGIIVDVPPQSLPEFEKTLRAEGLSDYQVRPRRERQVYVPIKYVEPLARNKLALGFDISAEPVELAAAEEARDTGLPTISGKVTLALETGDQSGFFLFLPFYRSALSRGTVEERRAEFLGWVFASLRGQDLMQGAFGANSSEVAFEIFDGNNIGPASLIYQSKSPGIPPGYASAYSEKSTIEVGGRTWTFGFSTLPAFDAAVNRNQPFIVLIIGTVTSLLLFGLALTLVNTRTNALRLAEGMTVTLRENESKLRNAQAELELRVRKRTADLALANETLTALHETTVDLSGRLDLSELLEGIVSRAAGLMGTRHGYIFLLTPDQSTMEMRVGIGIYSTYIGERVPYGSGFVGKVWQTEKPFVVDDYSIWPERVLNIAPDLRRAVVAVPLKSASQVVGVIGLAYVEDERKFGQNEIELLSRFANLASVALENARLYATVQEELVERKRAEEAVRESQERYRELYDYAPIAYYSIEAEDGRIRMANRRLAEMVGYAMDDLIGRPVFDLYADTPAGKEKVRKVFERFRAGEEIRDEELQMKKANGELIWVSVTARPVRAADGKIVHSRSMALDITERKEAARLKNEFISTVSHELRTPLTSIVGSLGLITGGAVGEIPSRVKAMIDIAYKNSERLVRLINDILDIEKIESGKMVFNFKPTELLPLVEQCIEANRAYAQRLGVSFRLNEKLPGVKVNADGDRLMQVMTNLLSNAAKFSPAGGSVDISMTRHNSSIRVAVRNYGPGIPEEFRSSLFTRFSQDTFQTRDRGGTGLGLSIAKSIVEKHGGQIGFESESNAGTTFYFDLPEWRERESVAAERRQDQPRVLICEDDQDVANLLAMILGQADIRTDIALDATQAKALLSQKQYGAMTLDLLLPDEDGISFIRELREQEKTQRLPIIVVSMIADRGRAELNGEAFWVADWIQKPVDATRLVAATRQAINQVAKSKPRILHVEDDGDNVQIVAAILKDVAETFHVEDPADAKQILQREHFGLVILDLKLPDGSGLELLPLLHGSGYPPTPVVIFSAHEVSGETARQVSAALVKARTSNRELLETIQGLIKPQAYTRSDQVNRNGDVEWAHAP